MASTLPPNLPQGYLEADRSSQIVGVAIFFIIAEMLATALRVLARHLQRKQWMWADIFMPISLLFNLGVCTCVLLGARWGSGKHTSAVPAADLRHFTILTYYGMATIYLCSVTFSKLAILDTYLHIFIDKFSRYAVYAVGSVVILSLVVNLPTVIAQCRPVSFLWDPVPGGWCNDTHAHFTWASLPNILTDFMMLILPIPMIVKLHASWRVKAGIFITFLVGSLGLVTAIIRFVEFYNFGWNNGFSDPTWASSTIFSWTVVEPGVYHLTACFITFRPLFKWLIVDSPLSSVLSRSRLFSGSKGTSNGTTSRQKGLPRSNHAGTMDDRSDRKTLV